MKSNRNIMAALNIVVGSVYGNAQHVAEEVEKSLSAEGVDCEVLMDAEVDDFVSGDALLVITSTTGQGDIPPNLELVYDELRDTFPLLNQKPFAVVGLGDSSYDQSFCGAGKKFFELLTELQGKPVADLLEVDAMETLEPEADVLAWLEGVKEPLI
jgi:flavodoxin